MNWYAEERFSWGWTVRNPSRQTRNFNGENEDSYVAVRLSDKATANLIAAAPDLLAAAEFFMQRLEQGIPPTSRKDYALLQAAITKARGTA